MELDLDLIRTDGGTQPRAQLDLFTVQEYADAMHAGEMFPPVIVFHDGRAHWLADGFHRLEAARLCHLPTIAADIRPGAQRDAVLYSVGTNASHGLRRTSADKRQAVLTLLNDPEWTQWSDREIARRCLVSHTFVQNLRPVLSGNVARYDERLVQRGDTIYKQNTANIGHVVMRADSLPDGGTTAPPQPAMSFSTSYMQLTEPAARPVIPMVEAEHNADQAHARPVSTPPARYPIPLVVSRPVWERWQKYKTQLNMANDALAFEQLMEVVYGITRRDLV